MERFYNTKYMDSCLKETYQARFDSITGFVERRLQIYEVENGFVLPIKDSFTDNKSFYGFGGVTDKLGNVFEPSLTLPNRMTDIYSFEPKDAVISSEEVIFIGAFHYHWGHFLLEDISRLYYFLKNNNEKLPLVYISRKPLDGNFIEFFELLGIDTTRLIHIDKIIQFKKIIIPEASIKAFEYFTQEYKNIIETVKSNVEPKPEKYEKVFYSTGKLDLSKYKDWGEIDEIEQVFENAGYQIIYPETKSVREQICIMKSCKKFASISGTLPHNLLFANKDVEATILNKSYIVNYHQWLVDRVTGIYPTYVDAQLSILPSHIGIGPFLFFRSNSFVKFAQDNDMDTKQGNLSIVLNFVKKYFIRYPAIYTKLDREIYRYQDFYLSQIKGFGLLKLLIYLFNITESKFQNKKQRFSISKAIIFINKLHTVGNTIKYNHFPI